MVGTLCITCSSLRNYSGSERIIYEYSKNFTRLGYEVSIACLDVGDFYFNEMNGQFITDQRDLLKREYDIIINVHWPSFFYFFENGVKARYVCHFSLSPFEPLEFPLRSDEYFDAIICNSLETKNTISSLSSDNDFIIFNNAISLNDYPIINRELSLNNVIIISNHPPYEMYELSEMFNKSNINCEIVGHSDNNQIFMDDKILSKYDLIITIGYTVIMGMGLKIPIYIYDHFGGDGWIDSLNLDLNCKFNFSGRPNYRKLNVNELFNDIVDGYESNLKNIDLLYEHVKKNHEISRYIKELSDNAFKEALKFRAISSDVFFASCSYNKMLLSNRFLERKSIDVGIKSNNLKEELVLLQNELNFTKDQFSKYQKINEFLIKYQLNYNLFKKKLGLSFNTMINIFNKIKFKFSILSFLFKRVLFHFKNRGLKYTVNLVLNKKDQAFFLVFPRCIKKSKVIKDNGFILNSEQTSVTYVNDLVSVIIPIYNRTWELKEAIDSILSQTYKNIELILVTDGSPDETLEVINDYSNDHRVKIFNFPISSGNAVRGRNKGILEAKGEYIAFLDSDDISLENRIEVSVDFLNKNKEYSGVYGTWLPLLDGSRLINGIENDQPVFSPDGSFKDHVENCIPCQSSVMLRAADLRAVGGINTIMKYREDHELWVRLTSNGYQLKSLKEPLVRLRLHAGNNELSFNESNEYWYKVLLEQYNKKISLPKKIVWIVAGLGISGGLAIILKHANYLLSQGHDVSLFTLSNENNISWYDNKVPVYVINDCKDYLFDNIDLLIATAWNTEPVLEQLNSKRKLYFVQSDERRFMDCNVIKKQIEEGYNKNYEYFTEAYWIQKMFHNEFNKPAFYVPNGIDTDLFNSHELFEKKNTRKRVLIEGPIDIPFKAVEDCYNAVKDLDCDIWFVSSAGKPKDDWRYDKFFEKVPMSLMPSIYSSCDIFIKMSRIEGFFGPPLEAMACGCIPVVGKVSGWDEYIVDGVNALAVDLGDIESAKNAVNQLINDECLGEKLLNNGLATVSEWGWDKSFMRINLLVNK